MLKLDEYEKGCIDCTYNYKPPCCHPKCNMYCVNHDEYNQRTRLHELCFECEDECQYACAHISQDEYGRFHLNYGNEGGKIIISNNSIKCIDKDENELIVWDGTDIHVSKNQVHTYDQLYRFKKYWDELYGQGLEVAYYHYNGNLEPFDNFYDAAIEYMERENN